MLFCWVWNITFMLISCKTGINTDHTFNLLRWKMEQPVQMKGNFLHKKKIFLRKHHSENQINTHTGRAKPNSSNLHEVLCSNTSTVPHHLFPVPELERIIPVGQLVWAFPKLCQRKLHQQLRVFSDRWSWTGSRLLFLYRGSFSFTHTITTLDPLCDPKAKNCEGKKNS